MTSITDPLNHVTTMTDTTAGLVATITDAQNHVTTYAYDERKVPIFFPLDRAVHREVNG